jgi:hypothetical protein
LFKRGVCACRQAQSLAEMDADTQLIQLLRELRGLVKIASWALVAVAKVFVVRTVFQIVNELRRIERRSFRNEMEDLYDGDDFDAVIARCDARLKQRPDDAWAHWYKGLAEQERGNHAVARDHMIRVGELRPNWMQDSVQPVTTQIDQSMSANKSIAPTRAT